MKLVVGLGNTGEKYRRTRHNAGFLSIDLVLQSLKKEGHISDWKFDKDFEAEIAGGEIGNTKIILMKPETFMNESGRAVSAVARFYKLKSDDLIVIHDDKDLPLGETKVQRDRGSAGHNGVSSLIKHLGTQDFFRVRIGIAPQKKLSKDDVPKFVLGKFGLFEWGRAQKSFALAAEAVKNLILKKD